MAHMMTIINSLFEKNNFSLSNIVMNYVQYLSNSYKLLPLQTLFVACLNVRILNQTDRINLFINKIWH